VNHEFWYLSRAAGFTAYLLLFVSVALGISMGTRLTDRIARRNAIFDLHRFTTILALFFTLFHVYILLGDSYFQFNVWQLSIPFLTPYRTWQTAVGVASIYLLLLLVISFYVRQFIGYRAWRMLHYLTFALFAGATLHGLSAGTDTSQAWAKLIYIVCGAGTVALIMYRIQYHMPEDSAVRTLRLASAIGTVVVAIVIAFGTGLFAAGKAPSAVVADAAPVEQAQAQPVQSPATSPAPAGPTATPDPHPFLASFDNDFSGTYQQTSDATGTHLMLDGVTSGDLTTKLHVELQQTRVVPTPDNEDIEKVADDENAEARPAVTIAVNKAELIDPASGQVVCEGKLTALDGGYLKATCDGVGPYAGVRISVSSRVQAAKDGSFSGALSGSMQRLG
jgi:sulfoxide reductase heme-binding subunit YedZ